MSEIAKKNGGQTGMKSWFDDFFDRDWFFDQAGAGFPPMKKWMAQVPAVNIREGNGGFTVELAAPGLRKEDFKIRVENGVLNIRVQKSEETKTEQESFTRREYSFNSFSRSFSLPETVEEDKISATYTDGVLMLRVPRKEEKHAHPPHKEIQVH